MAKDSRNEQFWAGEGGVEGRLLAVEALGGTLRGLRPEKFCEAAGRKER